MLLRSLLAALPAVRLPETGMDEEIDTIVSDSRQAGSRMLFVAQRGPEQDGHAYARQAYDRGCRAFVCEYPPSLPPDAAVAYVPDSRSALAALAAKLYGYPAHRLTLVGITGTKGKTTTAMMIYHLLTCLGIPAGYIGSGGVQYAGMQEKTENTTPSAMELHRVFSEMCRAHVRVVVMEVSSQAIVWQRIAGLTFPICLFTNLASDHIGEGEHPDFAHYRDAKARLFSDYGCATMITNLDDESASYMVADSTANRIITVSCQCNEAALFATRIRPTRQGEAYGTSFLLCTEAEGEIPVSIGLPGECNVSNALLALSAVQAYLQEYQPAADARLRSLAPLLSDLRIPGRFEPVKTVQPGVDYLIDYAHNGYSLRAALAALRAYSPGRLVCLFGSVGARTYSRRTELGEAACEADFCIVTTDNPGIEPPEDTMREICRVLEEHGCPYIAIPDREQAIRYAVMHAHPGDLILLAGKGHEDYQLIGEVKTPFSERKLLLAAAEEAVPVV